MVRPVTSAICSTVIMFMVFSLRASAFSSSSAGTSLGRSIFNTFDLLVILQGEHGVEQADDEVLVLAEYLLESQVGFRV